MKRIEQLLDEGADIEGADRLGPGPLEAAILLRLHPRILETLIAHGANLQPHGRSLLFRAFPNNCQNLILLLLKHGANPNVRDRSFSTPLHSAAMRGWSKACAALLDRGAVLDAVCERGFTPVYLATYCHCPNVVQLLRQRGAHVNFKPPEVDPYPMRMAARWAALLASYPAFVPGSKMGDLLRGLDAETGLPVTQEAILDPVADWVTAKAQSAALRRYVRLHGLPWNSRLPWIEIFRHPEASFKEAEHRGQVVTLEMNGPCASSPDGKTTVALRNRRFDLEAEEHLVVTSPTLFPWEYNRVDADFEAALRQRKPVTSVLPKLRGPRTEISIGWCPNVDRVRLCWGPEGAPLALVQFPEPLVRRDARHLLVLDLGLGALSYPRVLPQVDLGFKGGWIPPRRAPFGSHRWLRPRSDHRRETSERRREDGVLWRVRDKSCPPSAPIVLRFCLGGVHAPQPSSFEWDEDLLMLRTPSVGGGSSTGRRPSEAEWQAFWKMCDGFRVWSWAEDELAGGVVHGRTFSLVFQTEKRFVSASGRRFCGNQMRKVQLLHKVLTRMTLKRDPTPAEWTWSTF